MKRRIQCRLTPGERKAIRAFSRRLRDTLGPRLVSVLLFGSKARGDYSAASDIDIYVLVRNKRAGTHAIIAAATADILETFDILLSPVCYDLWDEQKNLRMKSPFVEAVKREGIPL